MCSGKQDFVFSVNHATGITEAAPTWRGKNDLWESVGVILNLAEVEAPDSYGWTMKPELRKWIQGPRGAVVYPSMDEYSSVFGNGSATAGLDLMLAPVDEVAADITVLGYLQFVSVGSVAE